MKYVYKQVLWKYMIRFLSLFWNILKAVFWVYWAIFWDFGPSPSKFVVPIACQKFFRILSKIFNLHLSFEQAGRLNFDFAIF